jgi:predicted aldo/keto reductase-like oxidoreductase
VRAVLDHFEKDFGKNLFKGIDPKRAELYLLCKQRQVGITTMKPLGAGKIISAEHTPFAKPLTVAQCIHYALSKPGVACVLPGCKTRAEMEDVLDYFNRTGSERDFSEVLGTMRNDFKGSCVYCSHCQPCPKKIDIATVHKYLDIAKLNVKKVPPSIKSHYQSLETKGSDCTSCSHCESRCPFAVPVMKNIAEAEKLLG